MKRESGFTLTEALIVFAIVSTLAALSYGPLRSYWLTQSLYGSRTEVRAQLQRTQSQVTSESFPLVYGIRFPAGGSNRFDLVQYNGSTTPKTCRQYATSSTNSALSPGGAQVTFPNTSYHPVNDPTGFGFVVTDETSFCRSNLTGVNPPSSGSDQYAWFYARGTAVPGRLQITHPALPGKALILTVRQLTGRVTSP